MKHFLLMQVLLFVCAAVSGDSRMHDILAYTPAALLMPGICPLQCSGGSANARPQQHV